MFDKLQQQIGYSFNDIHLLEQALDRRSYTSSSGEIGIDRLQLALDTIDSLDISVQGFLRRQLRSSVNSLASPTKTKGTVFADTVSIGDHQTHEQSLDKQAVSLENNDIKDNAYDIEDMAPF